MSDLEHVQRLCERLGAAPAQARIMATQLLKRADQLVQARGCSRVEALQYLLELTTMGASGASPPGFEGGPPPSGSSGGAAERLV